MLVTAGPKPDPVSENKIVEQFDMTVNRQGRAVKLESGKHSCQVVAKQFESAFNGKRNDTWKLVTAKQIAFRLRMQLRQSSPKGKELNKKVAKPDC